MITVTLISTFLSFSLVSSTEAVDELRRDYGEVRGTLQAYHGLLRDRIDPSPALALSNTLLSAGFIAGIHSESRETSNVVLFSEGASGLASLAQLGIGIWMPRSDVKVGALKFSEFYTWGFRAVGQFFYGRQLLEAGLNQEDPIKGRRLEERGSLHQNLGWFTALWGFQSTFLRSWDRYAELEAELQRLDETPETSPDYMRAKIAHAQKVATRFRQLIVDDLELRGTIEVAVASAATALIALKAPDDKQSAYYAVAGLGLSTGLYKLIAAWTLEELPLSEEAPGNLVTQLLPLPGGALLSVGATF